MVCAAQISLSWMDSFVLLSFILVLLNWLFIKIRWPKPAVEIALKFFFLFFFPFWPHWGLCVWNSAQHRFNKINKGINKKATSGSFREEWKNMSSIYWSQYLIHWKTSINSSRYNFSNYHYCLLHSVSHYRKIIM